MQPGLVLLRYLNVAAAGTSGILALFWPEAASKKLFLGTPHSDASRMLGAIWIAFALLCAVAGGSERVVCTIGLVQLIYKSLYLTVVVFPKFLKGKRVNIAEFVIFSFYVAVLIPLALPWSRIESV